jgi:hypothetical protein
VLRPVGSETDLRHVPVRGPERRDLLLKDFDLEAGNHLLLIHPVPLNPA